MTFLSAIHHTHNLGMTIKDLLSHSQCILIPHTRFKLVKVSQMHAYLFTKYCAYLFVYVVLYLPICLRSTVPTYLFR